MKNFRYYLALFLFLFLAISVRMHAASPAVAASKYTRATEVSRYLGHRLQLYPHQVHQVYRLVLEAPATTFSANRVDQHFIDNLKQVVSPAQYERFVALEKSTRMGSQIALLQ